MKRLFLAAAMAAVTLTAPAFAADVGVSVSIGQPGFYGRIDIGDYPRPRLIYSQPIIVDHRMPINRSPIYLRVPPGHSKHWDKHCREYNACNQRVLFVHDDWYEHEYVPHYQKQHRDRGDGRRDHDRGRGNDR